MVPTKGTYADELTQQQRDSLTPQQIIEAMKNGHARFRSGERKDRNYLREQQASASGQHPKAALAKDIAITLFGHWTSVMRARSLASRESY